MDSIKNKDMDRLSPMFILKGLRFSPYGHIDTESSQVFTVEEVKILKKIIRHIYGDIMMGQGTH